jgi:hypothetical protein
MTRKRVGESIGVHLYHQLSIAIMEKHAKSVSKPFNLYGDRSPAADLEVVFSWHRYLGFPSKVSEVRPAQGNVIGPGTGTSRQPHQRRSDQISLALPLTDISTQ